MAITTFIGGREIAQQELDAWERRRLFAACRRLGIPLDGDICDLRDRLAETKRSWGYERLVARLRKALRLSTVLSIAMARTSGRRRVCSVVVLRVDGISAEEASRRLECVMLEATPTNDSANLAACPDHWVLRPHGGTRLEVIEATGGSPFPTQFFIEFGDESGLTTKRDLSFPYQSTGTARARNGSVIGGVRHQFRDDNGRVEARLCVEFPAVMPRFFVREHQMHLACEFSNWFRGLIGGVDISASPCQ